MSSALSIRINGVSRRAYTNSKIIHELVESFPDLLNKGLFFTEDDLRDVLGTISILDQRDQLKIKTAIDNGETVSLHLSVH